jgi:heat shock protein HslJ
MDTAIDAPAAYDRRGVSLVLSAVGAIALLLPLPSLAADDLVTARGNEPSWQVTISGSEIELVTNMGADRVTFPTPAPIKTTVYAIPEKGVTISVAEQICRDTMSGMVFPLSVTVDGASDAPLSGCGGEPASLLAGDEWIVESIGGQPVVANSQVTLAFGDNNHLSGAASCNRYFASWKLSGEGLSIADVGSTMMACAEPGVSEQEAAFLAAVTTVSAFDIAEDGALNLLAGGDTVIVARR